VQLLLIQGIVGEDHEGFRALLTKAKESLNKPWLGTGLTQADVRNVAADKRDELDAAFVLAQRIGPILAEGTKGNPRQIKRFLNPLTGAAGDRASAGIRRTHQSAGAREAHARRAFPAGLYDHVSALAMSADGGKVAR
jgi:hypothetical protein